MQQFDVEPQKGSPSNAPKPSGLFISTKILIVIGVVLALVFAGSICATYFGKSCTDCNKNLNVRCGDYYCENKNILEGN